MAQIEDRLLSAIQTLLTNPNSTTTPGPDAVACATDPNCPSNNWRYLSYAYSYLKNLKPGTDAMFADLSVQNNFLHGEANCDQPHSSFTWAALLTLLDAATRRGDAATATLVREFLTQWVAQWLLGCTDPSKMSNALFMCAATRIIWAPKDGAGFIEALFRLADGVDIPTILRTPGTSSIQRPGTDQDPYSILAFLTSNGGRMLKLWLEVCCEVILELRTNGYSGMSSKYIKRGTHHHYINIRSKSGDYLSMLLAPKRTWIGGTCWYVNYNKKLNKMTQFPAYKMGQKLGNGNSIIDWSVKKFTTTDTDANITSVISFQDMDIDTIVEQWPGGVKVTTPTVVQPTPVIISVVPTAPPSPITTPGLTLWERFLGFLRNI